MLKGMTGVVLIALTISACKCLPQEPAARPPERTAVAEPAPAPAPAAQPAARAGCSGLVTIATLAPSEVDQGAPFDYTIRVTNTSDTVTVTDVTVTDKLPAEGFTYESSSPAGKPAGNLVAWNLGQMRPGETRDIAVRGRATRTGVLTNCGSVAYTPSDCVSTRVVAGGLELTKTAPADVLVCDAIPLRFVVSNPGTGAVSNVKVADQLPEGWTVDGQRTVSFDVGTLKSGESRELTASARAARTGKFASTATATADGGLVHEAAASTQVRQPVLAISRTASVTNQVVSRETKFTITVKNTGDATAADLTITDALTGVDAIGSVSDAGATTGNSTITWNLGNLAAGAERSVTFTANRATAGALAASATAKGVCATAVTAAVQTKYAGVPAVLLEVVDDTDPVVVNNTTTYTITVTNQGTAPATAISILCETDPTVKIVSTSGATPVAGAPASIRFETLAVLAPKASAAWKVVVRAAKSGDTRFKVVMTTGETERPIEETEATRFYD